MQVPLFHLHDLIINSPLCDLLWLQLLIKRLKVEEKVKDREFLDAFPFKGTSFRAGMINSKHSYYRLELVPYDDEFQYKDKAGPD